MEIVEPAMAFLTVARATAAACVCLLIGPTPSSQAQRYIEITAEIEMFSIPRTNEYSFSVVCITGTNEWRMNPSFQRTGTSQWYFDGTNEYRNIIAIGGPRPLGAPIRSEELLAAITNGTVHLYESRDGFPAGGGVRALVPWLAFCSGTYLKREARLVPLPIISSFRQAPDGFAYSDETETFDDELGLPRSIMLFASDALFAASVTNGAFVGKQDVELWKRGSTGFKWDIPEGALRFRYDVIESTNFLGWNVPLTFELILNVHEEGQMVARSGGKGRVTSIRASERPQGVLVPGTRQTIVDWRFRDDTGRVNAIIYPWTNAHAAPTNDLELQRIFAERVKRASGGSR